jgi:beta-glucanase (GH16 family)
MHLSRRSFLACAALPFVRLDSYPILPAKKLPAETGPVSVVMEDNFISPLLDLALWTPTYSNGGQDQLSNLQVEWYEPGQVTTGGGECQLTARRAEAGDDIPPGHTWLSGIISARRTFLFGTVVVRAMMPAASVPGTGVARGLWPGICLLAPGQWPPEYDLVETGPEPDTIYVTDHWKSGGIAQQFGHGVVGYDPTVFHDYTLTWSPTEVLWFIDGHLVFARTKPSSISTVPMQLTIGLGVGGPGSWSGPPDADTPSPSILRIASVRITQ